MAIKCFSRRLRRFVLRLLTRLFSVKRRWQLVQGNGSSLRSMGGQKISPTGSPTGGNLLYERQNSERQQRQLLIDVSELVLQDAKSGIQRVVRSILLGLFQAPPTGYEIVPVYWDGWCFRQANQLMSNLFPDFFHKLNRGPRVGEVIDTLVTVSRNDIFLGLDLTAHLILNTQTTLSKFKALGVEIYFVVYDLLLVEHPEWFSRSGSQRFICWLEIISELSTGLVCISQATADAMQDWLVHFLPHRADYPTISVFHLGADIDKSLPSGGLPVDAEEVLGAIATCPTFLMVGTVEPRKGHAQSLAAFDLLWQSDTAVNLVIVGKQGWNVEPLAQQLNTHRESGQRLFWLQGISDEYLEKIYAASTVLLAAAEGEGFGLPLIEAAQRQLPIIARNLPVFCEVAGEYAFYFEGVQPKQLAEAIQTWLRLCREKAVPNSGDMPWLTWAESTQQLLKAILPCTHYGSNP